ncbi:MAG: hypothetical protein ACHQ9S_13915 [Candidatus Binatia bacterium]
MSMQRADRSTLRLADLKQPQPARSRLINMKIPAHQADAIAQLATRLGASKTEVVIALLTAGLEQGQKKRG